MKKSQNDVRLAELDGAWAVYVTENGKTEEKKFDGEAFARNFATGQLLRLGLKAINAGAAKTAGGPNTRQAELDKWLLEDAKRRRSMVKTKPVRGRS